MASSQPPLDGTHAAVYFLSSYTGGSWGMTPEDTFLVRDVTELDPYLYVAFTGLALGVVLGRARRRDALPA